MNAAAILICSHWVMSLYLVHASTTFWNGEATQDSLSQIMSKLFTTFKAIYISILLDLQGLFTYNEFEG